MEGWIKLHRKIIDKSFYRKDSEAVHLWIHILICANRTRREEVLGGKKIICEPGQFTTGRKQLSESTGINESKIERLLNKFEKIEQQIEQQKTNTNRLISVLNWNEYQLNDITTEQQLNNERTTTEQQLNTLQEVKEVKDIKEIKKERKTKVFIHPTIDQVREYFKENGYSEIAGDRAFKFYNVADWVDSKGNKVLNWKQKMQSVWFKPENESRSKTNGSRGVLAL